MAQPRGIAENRLQTSVENDAAAAASPRDLGQVDFLGTFFRALDEHGIRYCVLHSYEGLPDELPGDLDLAVHPRDLARIPWAFQQLQRKGYRLVQCLNYAVRGHYFVLFWFEEKTLKSIAIDIIDGHWRKGLILASGESLVAGRKRHRDFWIPSPASEFAYLLAKKSLKASISRRQEQRLCSLVSELGRDRANRVAAGLVGHKRAKWVVDSCASGSLSGLLKEFKSSIWRATIKRNPLVPVRHQLSNTLRLMRRWFQPSGLFVCVLGPDGAGKSTLIEHLSQSVGLAFRRKQVFHWRPGLLGRTRGTGPVTDPHGQPPRPTWSSVVYLFGRLLDYWLGYCFVIRPLLVRSSLVVFDRYYYDLLVDPKRYRYGGPRWLARLLSKLVVAPDLALVLDAPEHTLLSRKNEVSVEEVKRQRRLYLEVAGRFSCAVLLDAHRSVREVGAEADRKILRLLGTRFQRRHKVWIEPRELLHHNASDVEHAGDALEETLRVLGSPTLDADPIHKVSRPLAGAPPANGNAGVGWYAVLPSKQSPRWMLPLVDALTMRKGLDIYAPYTPSARLAKKILGWAIDLGWQGWLCQKVQLEPLRSSPLEALVREILGEKNCVLAMSLSRPGAFRKLTIQVMRPSGEVLGYIKLPLTERATLRIRQEAEILAQLWNFAVLHPYIPRVLHAGPWGHAYVLFQSPGPSTQGPVAFGTPHREFLDVLRGVHRAERPGSELIEEVTERWRRLTPRLDQHWRHLASTMFEDIERELSAAAIVCGITHGDLAPWNTRIGNSGLFVFDWESCSWNAPIQWDLFHFHWQVASLLTGRAAASSREVLKSWSSMPQEAALLKLYVFASITRLVEEGTPIRAPAFSYRRRLLQDFFSVRHSSWRSVRSEGPIWES